MTPADKDQSEGEGLSPFKSSSRVGSRNASVLLADGSKQSDTGQPAGDAGQLAEETGHLVEELTKISSVEIM